MKWTLLLLGLFFFLAGCAESDAGSSLSDSVRVSPTPTPTAGPISIKEPTEVPKTTGIIEGDGVWIVGKDIEPGIYQSDNVADLCYWARLSGFSGSTGDILANDNIRGRAVVKIEVTDVGFLTQRCGKWYLIEVSSQASDTPTPTHSFTATPEPTLIPTMGPTLIPSPTATPEPTFMPTVVPTLIPSPTATPTTVIPISSPMPDVETNSQDIADGTWIVGEQLPPGIYETTGEIGMLGICYWSRLSGLSGELSDVIANRVVFGKGVVEIFEDDVAFTSLGCGFWKELENSGQFLTSISEGTWVVNNHIRPGTYQAANVESQCYWERLQGFSGEISDVIANRVITGQSVVTIGVNDAGFHTQGCGEWKELENNGQFLTSISEGTWVIDNHIGPGTYQAANVESQCYWERLEGFSGEISDVIANGVLTGQSVVTIDADDVGFHTQGCGKWDLIEVLSRVVETPIPTPLPTATPEPTFTPTPTPSADIPEGSVVIDPEDWVVTDVTLRDPPMSDFTNVFAEMVEVSGTISVSDEKDHFSFLVEDGWTVAASVSEAEFEPRLRLLSSEGRSLSHNDGLSKNPSIYGSPGEGYAQVVMHGIGYTGSYKVKIYRYNLDADLPAAPTPTPTSTPKIPEGALFIDDDLWVPRGLSSINQPSYYASDKRVVYSDSIFTGSWYNLLEYSDDFAISKSPDEDIFIFDAAAGQSIDVYIYTSSIDPHIRLMSPDEIVLAHLDELREDFPSISLGIYRGMNFCDWTDGQKYICTEGMSGLNRLPLDGRYKVIVKNLNEDGSGSYTIRFRLYTLDDTAPMSQ